MNPITIDPNLFAVVINDAWGSRKFDSVADLGGEDLEALWLLVSQEVLNRKVPKEELVVTIYNNLEESPYVYS